MRQWGQPSAALPCEDLEHVVTHARCALTSLDGAQVLITGGNGFLGSWMAETLVWAKKHLEIDVAATLLLRDPQQFRVAFPHLAAEPSLRIHHGSLENASLDGVQVTHVIHAAAPVVHGRIPDSPRAAFDAIVTGTRRLLDVSSARGAHRFLLLSSGAVYGTQPPELEAIPEDFGGGPDPMDPASVYGESKRAAELLCAMWAHRGTLETVSARCFTFLGPRLPLDGPYAVGNFLRDRTAGRSIRVSGDGTPWRSYIYAADAAVWLWTLLASGSSGRAYNVGSDDARTILQLAHEVGSMCQPVLPVAVETSPERTGPPSRYVPSVDRARRELGLTVRIPRREALRRTLHYILAQGG